MVLLSIGEKCLAQDQEQFTINIKQVEYIDANTEQLTYLDSENLAKELQLSRNYNHVYIELEDSPTTQYSFKVTGEASLGDWKKSTNEIHLVGLSRGEHQLCIRGERNGVMSDLQQFKIFIPSPFYLKWWFVSLIVALIVYVFICFWFWTINC